MEKKVNETEIRHGRHAYRLTAALLSGGREARTLALRPDAVRDGFTFDGWFAGDERVGGAGDNYVPASDVTLVAHWTESTVTPGDEDDDGTEGFPYWILALILTAIIGIAAFVTRNWILAVVTVVAGIVTALLYAGVI